MISFRTQIMPNVATRRVVLRHPEVTLKKLLHSGHRFLLIIIIMFLSSCAARHTHFMQQLETKRLKDGIYIGQDTALPMCGVNLSVTVKDNQITDIKILSHWVTYPLAGRAYAQVPPRIIKEQSLDVDAVTAATVSTNNIKMAVLKALQKASE